MKKKLLVFLVCIFIPAFLVNAFAGSGYVIVTEVIPVTIKISKQQSIEKGTSGLGATGGGLAGAWTGFKYGGLPGAVVGVGVGALGGNSLEKGIRDKKGTTENQEAFVPGFFVKLSNKKSFYSTTLYVKGQRISLEEIEGK